VGHIGLLIEQFEYMSDVSFRLNDETLPELKKSFKEESAELIKKEKYKHI